MHKIACIVIHEYYGNYDDPSENIVTHITDFQEVDDETFDNLKKASKDWEVTKEVGQFYVLEQKDREFTQKTLDTYLELSKKRAERAAKAKIERERKAAEAKKKKAANSKKKMQEKIAQLQAELASLEKVEK